ncbi:MAG TPA: AraC family transcriptional regulator, partial [Chthonomonadales bacterium]|nr:AraC family transcriptional regulator [Chthonomonadales bacterium]
MRRDPLNLHIDLPLQAHNGGLFVSRGQGVHPDRKLTSSELIFVRKGVLSIQEEETPFEVAPGQSLILWQGRRHRGTAPFSPDLSFYWLHFTSSHGHARSAQKISQHVTLSRPDHMTGLFRRFLDDQESGAGDATSASLLLMLMLWEVARSLPSTGVRESASIHLAARADSTIRTQFHKELTPAILAEMLGCNANYLGRVFHEVYQHTLTDTIHQCRVRYARQLLLDDDRNIDEVARACGFNDTGYFRRLFKRYEGITPLAFRKL